jgi:hypothetical protein
VSLTNGVLRATYYWKASKFKWPIALFTKILTIKNCRKCKTKIKKSFTKILMIILSVKIVLTLRVKISCRKCKILNVREKFVLSVIVSEKKTKKNIAAAFVLLFQNERAIHRERIFRDRTQNLDTLSDIELICRYRFPRQLYRTYLLL